MWFYNGVLLPDKSESQGRQIHVELTTLLDSAWCIRCWARWILIGAVEQNPGPVAEGELAVQLRIGAAELWCQECNANYATIGAIKFRKC
jgi:hypothetical protein